MLMLAWLVQSSEKVRCCVSQINALKDTITVPAFAINPLHLSQRWRRVPQSVGRRYGGNSIKKGALGDFTAAPPVRRIHNTPSATPNMYKPKIKRPWLFGKKAAVKRI